MPEPRSKPGEPFARGGCACGEVRYALASAPMFVNACHCTECQRQTGGPYAINAVIETDRITVTKGAPEPVPVWTQSGSPHDIWRCPVCRGAVWSEYGRGEALRFVRVATFDEPSRAPPQAHIFVASRLPWDVLPDDVPAFEIYYDLDSVWPAESLARRRAASAKDSAQPS